MLQNIELNFEDKEKMLIVTKALANEVRINILELLNANSLNINEIAEKLDIPMSTAAVNIKYLENAGLIFTELQPGIRGSMKLSSRKYDNISIKLYNPQAEILNNSIYLDMPIGNYTDCDVYPTCGLVSEKKSIGIDDDPSSFYYSERTQAQLLWFYKGYVEYKFPNSIMDKGSINLLELSFEACSEAPFYRNNWPSDITVWINGNEIGTWLSPGDFGGRRGKYNPSWWPDTLNQYGLLKTWRVTNKGSLLDEQLISDVTLDNLELKKEHFISVRIGIKDGAKNIGGVSIFGKQFGDYPQNINMRLDYSIKKV
jgi:predicted transcriptional regulator